ncbi:type I restriction-modification enzyme R subunit C-terminal domain-containing protein [Micromonospora sp. NPDC049102]|uniref:type I restriction-modification enzyme R subunit C-terminal domain-containing protein n=1 Tax=Micromonospora sp. NPDC049102 TaxID=3364265 RepID=UPI00372304B5
MTDLDELERMLAASGGGTEDFDQARRSAHGLGLFICSLVGLDREAATEVFGDFLSSRTLNANQINFVNLIIADLTQNGVMEPELLYDSPFIDIVPHGPDSILPSSE